jgi:hypothetical protein
MKKTDGQSCRALLYDLVEEEWKRLTVESSNRHSRAIPDQDDAQYAFISIKHTITNESGLLHQSVPQLRLLVKQLPLRQWLKVLFGL